MLSNVRNLLLRFWRRLSELGAALVWPIERAVSAVARVCFSTWENAEGLLNQCIFGLTWPFRKAGIVATSIVQFLLPTGIRMQLAAAVMWLPRVLKQLSVALLRASERIDLDRPVYWMVWLLQPAWKPVAAVGGFLHAWFVTREWREMKWGLPAVIMLLPFGVIWARSLWAGDSAIVSRYRLAVKEALEAQEYKRAQLYERKLAQLGVNTSLTAFRTAVALAEEGKTDEAYERMRQLAPEDQPGYPNAHFWQVQRLLSGTLVDDQAEALRLAGIHLGHIKTLQITNPGQQWLEAVWLAQNNKLEDAVRLLQPLITSMPVAAFESLRINLRLNRPEKAREAARALIGLMGAKQRRNAELNIQELQWWYAAEEILGNMQQMRTILEQWNDLEPENVRVKSMLASIHRRQAAQALRAPLPDQAQIVEHWLTAAELDDDAASLLKLARAIYQGREQNPLYENLLIAMRESPRSPVQLLLAVGTEAALAEHYDDARSFFAAAVDRDDTNPIAWNNYGLVLGEGGKSELEEALVAVNRALEIAPKEYRFRETRGQILLKLERWQEAISDLEFALNGLPTLGAIHESLAIAYSATGEEELAELHRGQVD